MTFLITVTVWAIFSLPTTTPAAEKYQGDLAGVIYRGNHDGDTIRFDIPGVHPLLGDDIPVRLRGVDTPEMRGNCPAEREKARAAKKLVQEILSKAQRITLKETGRGKYFRIVARVLADDVDLGELLLKKRLAVPYRRGRRGGDWCLGEGSSASGGGWSDGWEGMFCWLPIYLALPETSSRHI